MISRTLLSIPDQTLSTVQLLTLYSFVTNSWDHKHTDRHTEKHTGKEIDGINYC